MNHAHGKKTKMKWNEIIQNKPHEKNSEWQRQKQRIEKKVEKKRKSPARPDQFKLIRIKCLWCECVCVYWIGLSAIGCKFVCHITSVRVFGRPDTHSIHKPFLATNHSIGNEQVPTYSSSLRSANGIISTLTLPDQFLSPFLCLSISLF